MNEQNEMIRASEGRQIIQDDQRIERDLQLKKRKLQNLRRQLLLASLAHCTSSTAIDRLWKNLKPSERHDDEIIYKLLACWTDKKNPNDGFFGHNPWSEVVRRYRSQYNKRNLPTKYLCDSKAVLAFVSNKAQSWHWSNRFNMSTNFEVPPSLRDNKEVMMAVCAKCPYVFQYASSRLRDDDDLVATALLDEQARIYNIRLVSKRLLKDKNMLIYLVSMGFCTEPFARSWLESLCIGHLHVEEQKEVICAIAVGLRHYSSWKDLCFLSKFSQEVLDDKDTMMSLVESNWAALQWCSDRLCSDSDIVDAAVSRNINAYQYVKGDILEEYQHKRNHGSVLKELDEGLLFRHVPDSLKGDRSIIMTAIKAGQALRPNDFPKDLKNDKEFILDAIAAHDGNSKYCDRFYTDLAAELQTDEDIARALLRIGFPKRIAILKKIPSLLSSREAMMLAVKYPESHYDDFRCFPRLVHRCNFRDDEEFMLEACKSASESFVHASERLRSNRDFVDRIMSNTNNFVFLLDTTGRFQLENHELIASVIEHDVNDDFETFFEVSDEVIWSKKGIVMACLQRGWSVLKHIVSLDANSPLLKDKDVILRSAKNHPADLSNASRTLRKDREFILALVKETDHVLHHAPSRMRFDKEILLAAVARSRGTITDCFETYKLDDDFEFLCTFAMEIRSAIATHESFMELLCCIHHRSSPSTALNHPGDETGIALKKKIAEYANIRFPIGPNAQSFKAALVNMENFGF